MGHALGEEARIVEILASIYPSAQATSLGQEWRGEGENPNPSTHGTVPSRDRRDNGKTQTQTRITTTGKQVSIARVTRQNVTRRLGVRLHPKASAALGLEAECATPKHLGTQVPRPRRWHALGTGYTVKSREPLGFRSKEGTCASTGAHPPGVTGASRWRRSALPVLPGVAFLGATTQV